MNLPIKLVDLVTLLFISLLVVIIIFIILQRNIKRFKLRNVKDPHFLLCKSVPKELRDEIKRKHVGTNAYREPASLLTSTYLQNLDDSEKTFILRMKAFEVSKHLESALNDYGYKRQLAMRFEDFIQYIIKLNDHKLPNKQLVDFQRHYVWAMLDPMPIKAAQLRHMSHLINSIIDHLALTNRKSSERIARNKLELSESGDYDFLRANLAAAEPLVAADTAAAAAAGVGVPNVDISEIDPSLAVYHHLNAATRMSTKRSKVKFSNKPSQPTAGVGKAVATAASTKNQNIAKSNTANMSADKQKLISDTLESSFDELTCKPASSSSSGGSKGKTSLQTTTMAATASRKTRATADDLDESKWTSNAADADGEQIPLVGKKSSGAGGSSACESGVGSGSGGGGGSHYQKKSKSSYSQSVAEKQPHQQQNVIVVNANGSQTTSSILAHTTSSRSSSSSSSGDGGSAIYTSIIGQSAIPMTHLVSASIREVPNAALENEAFNKTFDTSI